MLRRATEAGRVSPRRRCRVRWVDVGLSLWPSLVFAIPGVFRCMRSLHSMNHESSPF